MVIFIAFLQPTKHLKQNDFMNITFYFPVLIISNSGWIIPKTCNGFMTFRQILSLQAVFRWFDALTHGEQASPAYIGVVFPNDP